MKLIVHFGAGKTGSTSIQNTLKRNDEKLKEQGVYYLGMMLENAEKIKYEWQKPTSVVENFHRLSDEEAKKQILDVLRPTIEFSKVRNYHTLVWSNESFFGRQYNFKAALKQLQSEGIEIVFLAYVRKYDSWASSAYIQWGIKHKTYTGRLKNFHEWIKNSTPKFYAQINPLLQVFPNEVQVRNMNAVGDVAKDFLLLMGVNTDNFLFKRDNDAPGNEELLLRALFNDQYNEGVLPNRFNHIFSKAIDFSQTLEMYLKTLLPTDNDLKEVCLHSKDDREKLNALLVSQGQEPFNDEITKKKEIEVNSQRTVMALANIVMQQSRRMDGLEKTLQKLNENK